MRRPARSPGARSALLGGVLLALPAAAAADDRVATVHLGVGLPDLVGGGVSLTALRPFELELGGASGIIYTTVFARAGAALPLYDGRGEDGRGWLVEGLGMGGYRYLDHVPWAGDFEKHGAEVDVAAEALWWLARHFSLDGQVLVGGGLWIGSEADGGVAFFTDWRVTVGVGF
ncbi:MAG: hypothetical protein Q8P18_28380 [Pseudomonadota bacterium]|nr:hypothetical protein [Pseudomonadota bacterium]